MLNIGRPSESSDLSRLSDAELVAQLADQAKQLGIEIDLNYSFAQPKKTDEGAVTRQGRPWCPLAALPTAAWR